MLVAAPRQPPERGRIHRPPGVRRPERHGVPDLVPSPLEHEPRRLHAHADIAWPRDLDGVRGPGVADVGQLPPVLHGAARRRLPAAAEHDGEGRVVEVPGAGQLARARHVRARSRDGLDLPRRDADGAEERDVVVDGGVVDEAW
uniref:Uncharacterized protein n=1 Tax=Arundo donax TaxID=35708 RepID=A0A0A9E5H7_ARUDO